MSVKSRVGDDCFRPPDEVSALYSKVNEGRAIPHGVIIPKTVQGEEGI